jgi:ferredoxin
MSYARQLLDTYPGTLNADAGVLAATLDALSDCAQACAADADADLAEQNLAEMVRCIRLCLDCTDVCTATLGVVTRQTAYDPAITQAAAAGVRGHLQELRRRMRPARSPLRALPGLRAGLPPLRASVPGTAGRPAIADRPPGRPAH